MFMLIHRELHCDETPKPSRLRPWRRLGFPRPTEMDNCEGVVRRAEDHGVAAGAFRHGGQDKAVGLMADGDFRSCPSLQRSSLFAFRPKPWSAELG
jgi:hypothetical protein